MTIKERKEKRIQDYPRHRIEFPDPKKYGTPPFTSEKEARRYLKAIANFSESDMTRLLAWYLPTLYKCDCPDTWSDQRYGEGLRMQYDCEGVFYRCSNCGEERNPDGSKHIRKQRVSDVDIMQKDEVLDSKQSGRSPVKLLT